MFPPATAAGAPAGPPDPATAATKDIRVSVIAAEPRTVGKEPFSGNRVRVSGVGGVNYRSGKGCWQHQPRRLHRRTDRRLGPPGSADPGAGELGTGRH